MWQTDGGAKQSTRRGGPVWRKICKPSMSSYAWMNEKAVVDLGWGKWGDNQGLLPRQVSYTAFWLFKIVLISKNKKKVFIGNFRAKTLILIKCVYFIPSTQRRSPINRKKVLCTWKVLGRNPSLQQIYLIQIFKVEVVSRCKKKQTKVSNECLANRNLLMKSCLKPLQILNLPLGPRPSFSGALSDFNCHSSWNRLFSIEYDYTFNFLCHLISFMEHKLQIGSVQLWNCIKVHQGKVFVHLGEVSTWFIEEHHAGRHVIDVLLTTSR